MPITQALLTSGSGTNASVFTPASITPSANKLIKVSVTSVRFAAPPAAPTISGNSITYVQIRSIALGNWQRLTVFRAMGSPTSGSPTITFGATQDSCDWVFGEFGGVDTSGSNGSGAVRQDNEASVSNSESVEVPLGAFGAAGNATAGAFLLSSAPANIIPGSGFTEIADLGELQTEWRVDNDQTVDVTWVGSRNAVGVAIEIKQATTVLEIFPAGFGIETVGGPLLVQSAAGFLTLQGRTDLNGQLVLEVPAGTYAVQMHTQRHVLAPASQQVEVVDAQETAVTIAMPAAIRRRRPWA